MTIIIDTIIFSLQKKGGVSSYWYEMFQRFLKDSRCKLYVLGMNKGYIHEGFKQLNWSGLNGNLEKGMSRQIIRNLPPQIKRKICEPTIFQSTYLRVSRRKNIRNVVTVHDFQYQLTDRFHYERVKRWLNYLQKKYAFRYADAIVCISENTKKDLLRFFPEVQKERIRVIYNGVSEVYRPCENIELPEFCGKLKEQRFILYVGNRGGNKNYQFVINLIQQCQNLICVSIGGGKFKKSEIQQMGMHQHRFVQYEDISDETLNIFYNKAYAMVFPSLYEGFGMPVLEAMKTGCPVIAFENSSIPEVLRGSGILLQDNDLEGALYALKQLEDSKYRRCICERELKAASYFSWDKTYSEYQELYRSILG